MLELQPYSIICTVINILILLVGLRLVLFKPVNKILAARQAEIDDAMKEIDEKNTAAEETKAKLEDALKDVDKTKAEISAEARGKANAEYEKIILDANKKAKEIVDAAKKDAELEKNKILESANSEIAEMVMNATAKAMATKSDPSRDKELFEQFIRQAGQNH